MTPEPGTSKGKLQYAQGMTLGCAIANEWPEGNQWYRVEAGWEKSKITGKFFTYAEGYRRVGCYWIPFSNQRVAMEKRALVNQLEELNND